MSTKGHIKGARTETNHPAAQHENEKHAEGISTKKQSRKVIKDDSESFHPGRQADTSAEITHRVRQHVDQNPAAGQKIAFVPGLMSSLDLAYKDH